VYPESTPPPVTDRPKIIAFGDSLTVGYGIGGWENSYPAALQKHLDADGYNYQVLGFGLGGDTAAGGVKRLWLPLKVSDAKVWIVALGANDVVKKVPPEEIKRDLGEIIRQVKANGSKVLLCGAAAPAENGEDYVREIKTMYASLAAEYDVPLMPALMNGVSGNSSLLLPDRIHPNPDGTAIIGENVYLAIMPLLKKDDRNGRK
jgi:acyl-CoA thioesterase-1